MSVDQRIVTATEQLETDVKLTHDIVNGDENTEVQTEGGPVPSNAKVAKDSHDEIIGLLQPTVNDINQHADYVDGKVSEVKADANRADAAADRADQIAELETVRDALRLAAVPAPDFHLPLISDLRIEEGFGDPDQIDVSVAQDGSLMVDLPSRSALLVRTSKAGYVAKSGLFTEVEIDDPRFEKDGHLTEGLSTNLVKFCNEFSQMVGQGMAVIGNASYVVIPNGAIDGISNSYRVSNAESITSGSGGNNIQYQNIIVPADTSVYTGSVWVKSVGATKVSLRIPFSQKSTSITLTDSWQRLEQQDTNKNFTITSLIVGLSDGDFEICFFQLEQLPRASSNIFTQGVAATRANEFLAADISNTFKPPYTISFKMKANNYSRDFPRLFRYDDIRFESRSADNLTSAVVVFADGGQMRANGINLFDSTHITIVRDNTGWKIYINGALSGASTNTSVGDPINLQFGFDSGQRLYAWVRDFQIRNESLTPEQISALGAA